ncbi:MAG: acyltransferase domain-containing protein, partial [Oscillospiraceae bacterium]|nr:acyltransferase domain-containing protein [Oscillospiraceae bacterium]
MGKELYENFPGVKEIFTLGSEILSFNLREKIDSNELLNTTIVQPAVFAVSAAALHAAKEAGIGFSAAAGHSLGEYAALYACGVISLEDGFKLLKIRSEAMQKAAETSSGGMAAVMGLESEVVEAVCREITDAGDYVCAVNYNSPGQIVIAGSGNGLAKAEDALKSKGAKRVVKLNVAAAFHSQMMSGAAAEFKEKVTGFNFKTPEMPFYSNLTGAKLNEFSDMPDYLGKHICSPVLFMQQVYEMEKDGFEAYLELGPGKVLSGLVKKTLNNSDNAKMSAAVESAATRYRIYYTDDGWYNIVSTQNAKYLTLTSNKATTDGGTLTFESKSAATETQKWRFVPNDDGTYHIINKQT